MSNTVVTLPNVIARLSADELSVITITHQLDVYDDDDKRLPAECTLTIKVHDFAEWLAHGAWENASHKSSLHGGSLVVKVKKRTK